MNVKEIKELIELVADRGLTSLEVERTGFKLKIQGAPPSASLDSSAVHLTRVFEAPALPRVEHRAALPGPLPDPEPKAAQPVVQIDPQLHIIKSPIVGTFYRSPSPDAGPFVKPGDPVEKGQTLCIVEAMKLMNEIESDVAGVILDIFPQNGQPVEYGENLFSVKVR